MNKIPMACMAASMSLLLCGSLSAADLGQARVRSYRGQPLVIDVPLVMEGEGESDQLTAVATGNIADATGADQAVVFSHDMRRYPSGQHFIRLTSSAPIDTAKVKVWIMVEGPYGKASRSFLLNLRPKAATSAAASGANANPPVRNTSATPPRLTVSSLAAMNAQLDEETHRVTAMVAKQQQALTQQVAQLDRQRSQLAALDSQGRRAAEIIVAAKARLDERSRALTDLSAQLGGLLDAPVGEPAPASAPSADETVPPIDSVPASDADGPAVTEATLSPLPPQAQPPSGTPPASGETPGPGTNSAVEATQPAHASAPPRGNAMLWLAIGLLSTALAGNLLMSWRRHLRGTRTVSSEARAMTLHGLHATPATSNIPSAISISPSRMPLVWIDASGLTDNLVERIRRQR